MLIKNKIQTAAIILVFILWSYLVIHSFGYGHKIVYCFTTLFILYGIAHASKITAKFFVLVMTLLAFMLQPATSRFGPVDINMIAAIKYTNTKEAIEIISSFSLIDFLTMLLIAVLGISAFRFIDRINTKRKYAIAAIIASLIVITYKPIFANDYNHDEYINEFGYPPIRFIVNVKSSFDTISSDEDALKAHKGLLSDFSPTITNRKYNTYILVIGESVRRDYMGVYGFHVNNTPFLSSANGIFLDNYVSSSFSTVPSLTHSLILNKNSKLQFNNNILRLAKLSGMHTYWLSNQGVFGIYDSPVAMIGKDADYSYFIKNGDSDDGKYYPDEALLPEYTRIMKEKGDKLIVLHLIGSHPEACSRTNGIYDVSLKSKELSCYVQSIKNTDALLKQIVDIANKNDNRWSLIYFADHGLSHINDRKDLSHSDKYKENYSPPFVMINQNSHAVERIKTLRSGLDFINMFAQWIGVSDHLIKNNCNYFINTDCFEKPIVLDGSLQPKDFSTLPSDPADN